MVDGAPLKLYVQRVEAKLTSGDASEHTHRYTSEALPRATTGRESTDRHAGLERQLKGGSGLVWGLQVSELRTERTDFCQLWCHSSLHHAWLLRSSHLHKQHN